MSSLDALSKRLDRLAAELTAVHTVLRDMKTAPMDGTAIYLPQRARARWRGSRAAKIHALALQRIQSDGPVTTPELVEILETAGISLPAKNQANRVAATLSRAAVFVNISWKGGRAWWLTDRPTP